MQTPTALKKPAVSHTKDRPFGAKNKEGAICLRTYGGKHLFLTSNISSTKIKYSSLSWLHYNIKSRVICTCYFVRVWSQKHRVFWRSQLHRAIAYFSKDGPSSPSHFSSYFQLDESKGYISCMHKSALLLNSPAIS